LRKETPLSVTVPPAPEFGQPIETAGPSPETVRLLATRRSVSAATLVAPGPDRTELKNLLRIAARAPDHGKLAPWRFVVLSGKAKARLVEALEPLATGQPDPDKARAVLAKLKNPPVTVLVVSRLFESKIPEWEQQLSSGAVAMGLLIAAEAMGYAANWITDWYAYDAQARDLLGLACNERVAGFVHLGTAPTPPLERVRPEVDTLIDWRVD
jgi:nitroreductase